MKQNSAQQIFEDWQLDERNIENLFSSKIRNQFSEEFKNCMEKTSDSSLLSSGEWRTNILISEDPIHSREKTLTLKHTTSFEENSMENHGKRLKQSFIHYVNSVDKQAGSQDINHQVLKINYSSWDSIQQLLFQIQDFDEQTKNSLISFGKKNIEAQILLREIIKLIPENYLNQCLKIAQELFKIYKNESIEKMDEDQLQLFISLNYSRTAEIIREKMEKQELIPSDPQKEYLYEQMINMWMQSIFLALNGVLQNPYDRKTPIHELQGFQTFQTGRKLIKID